MARTGEWEHQGATHQRATSTTRAERVHVAGGPLPPTRGPVPTASQSQPCALACCSAGGGQQRQEPRQEPDEVAHQIEAEDEGQHGPSARGHVHQVLALHRCAQRTRTGTARVAEAGASASDTLPQDSCVAATQTHRGVPARYCVTIAELFAAACVLLLLLGARPRPAGASKLPRAGRPERPRALPAARRRLFNSLACRRCACRAGVDPVGESLSCSRPHARAPHHPLHIIAPGTRKVSDTGCISQLLATLAVLLLAALPLAPAPPGAGAAGAPVLLGAAAPGPPGAAAAAEGALIPTTTREPLPLPLEG